MTVGTERTDEFSALTGPARHVFLSPHYDDIPLSAGATVRLLAEQGKTPETVVVFGSEPDRAQPLTAFAQELHDKWGLTADEVIASRQAEERDAAGTLGARSSVLPFRDAIYRGASYLSDDDLFSTPVPAEQAALPAAIAAALDLGNTPDRSTRLYAPLGIGRHVDHQLVFATGIALADQGWDVWFYEDTPYALKPRAMASRLAELDREIALAPVARVPAAATWEQKLDAILCYPSQLETVFRQYVGVGTNRDEIDAALRAFATQEGDGTLAERFWHIANPARS
jgi:LmbE family N-acetylglucosaminyl deacetylase